MEKIPLEALLKERFEKNPQRHQGITWQEVSSRMESRPEAWKVLSALEDTGGEPDVVDREASTGRILFMDCSEETPKGRRSLCYDPPALAARKENKPAGSALGQAQDFGVEVLSEEDYRHLQTLGEFDRKTSSLIVCRFRVKVR